MVGKVALITGCSSGVGRELCRTLTEKGDRVVATARSLERLEGVSAALKVALDVTDQDSIKQAIAAVMNAYGRIDVLVNNAGYSVRSAVEEIDLEELAHLFDVNVYGIVRMIQAVAPIMRQQGAGKIINIGSVSGRLTGLVNGGYCARSTPWKPSVMLRDWSCRALGFRCRYLNPALWTPTFSGRCRKIRMNVCKTASPRTILFTSAIWLFAKNRNVPILAKLRGRSTRFWPGKGSKAAIRWHCRLFFRCCWRCRNGFGNG